MNKKNIDKLAQEKFKGFGEVPHQRVWESIEASLNKKKKSRKDIPFWWQLGGVAALLALMLYTINPFGQKTDTKDTIITNVEGPSIKNTVEKNSAIKDVLKTKGNEQEKLTSATKEDQNKEAKNRGTKNNILSKQALQQKASYATTGTKENQNALIKSGKSTKAEKKSTYKNLYKHSGPVTMVSHKEKATQKTIDTIKKGKGQHQNRLAPKKNTVVLNIDTNNDLSTDSAYKPVPNKKDTNAMAGTVANKKEKPSQKDIIKEVPKKNSIFDEIEKQKTQEETLAKNNGKNKWSAGPSVAPVYFDASGEGSPVHSIFVPNRKSGSVNLSYGLSVSYGINKRLSVRSGVHKVAYGYETGDISFSSSLNGSTNEQIANISYNTTSENLVLRGNASVNRRDNEFGKLDITAKSPEREGTMSQHFGYIEVPLELNYAVLDKKIGLNLIGGFSSLFLVDNVISVEADGQIMELGEANNLNSLNFSANAGIGVYYNFTPKLKLNLEPVFKYQLHTFSSTEGTFQPFSLGVYSGFSLRF